MFRPTSISIGKCRRNRQVAVEIEPMMWSGTTTLRLSKVLDTSIHSSEWCDNEDDVDDDSQLGLTTDDGQHYLPGQPTIHRCITLLWVISVTAIISAIIGLSMQQRIDEKLPLTPVENATLADAVESVAGHDLNLQGVLLNMAKSVNDRCNPELLSTATGRSECDEICHDHSCCFDSEDNDCRYDESKQCSTFAACKVLVVDDFVESAESTDPIQEDFQGRERPHIEAKWHVIRKNYINQYCAESNVKKAYGRKKCAKVCANHFCCFDASNDGSKCQHDKSMICDVYAACAILVVNDEKDYSNVDEEPNEGAGLDVAAPYIPSVDENNIAMPPDMIGDTLLPLLDGDYHVKISSSTAEGDMDNGTNYTTDELIQMKNDVHQRCSDYQTPIGRLHCEKFCKDHLCCFDEDGCQGISAKLCDVYDTCKVINSLVSLAFSPG